MVKGQNMKIKIDDRIAHLVKRYDEMIKKHRGDSFYSKRLEIEIDNLSLLKDKGETYTEI